MSIFNQVHAVATALLKSERFYLFWALHKKVSCKAWAVVVYDRTIDEELSKHSTQNNQEKYHASN
jgi:hypothetical protein